MFLKSSHIIPIEGPDISPGVIQISGNQIQAIGPPSLLKKNEKVIDLGSTVLLPGFVNTHCHLELTCLGPVEIPSPFLSAEALAKEDGERARVRGRATSFVPWIQEVVRRKTKITEKEMRLGIQEGIKNLLQSGVTTIGDHISFNTFYDEIIRSPFRVKLFGEVLGIVPEVCRDIYKALKEIQKKTQINITPHSVHAVDPDILKKVMQDEDPPLSCHLAESKAEDDYFKKQEGDMAKLYREMGCSVVHHAKSGLRYLKENNLPISKLMIIHGNYLDKEDLKIVKKERLSIVHCPGSHQFFGHKPFPAKKYLDEGINIALGTDSIASNTELNFLSELKKCKSNRSDLSDLSDRELLTTATLGGAKALRMDNEIGSLVPGKKADIVGFKIKKGQKPEKGILESEKASFVMIDGKTDSSTTATQRGGK